LSRDEQNAVSMSELAMNALKASITLHMNEAKFLCFCFSFCSNLCVHSEATVSVLSTGLVRTTIECLHRHKGVPELLLRALRALENICFSTKEVKDHLRMEGIEEAMARVTADNSTHDDVRRACKAVLDALNRTDLNLDYIPLKPIKLNIETNTAKKIFGDAEKKNLDVAELPQAVKNMLLAGALLMKHSNTANPRPRHVYITSDFKFLVWKDPKKPLHPDNKMKVFKIRTVEVGRCTPQLQRKQWGKFNAKEECAFAVLGRDRTVDLEASNETERDKWVDALMMLVSYRKALKKANTQFASR